MKLRMFWQRRSSKPKKLKRDCKRYLTVRISVVYSALIFFVSPKIQLDMRVMRKNFGNGKNVLFKFCYIIYIS